jgi:bifunctional DNA-binding transcriptional regulator/antitoxin component of YhaV-PrlF toxin-antitoxin module
VALRKELGLEKGTYFEMSVTEEGTIVLHPVAIYRTIRLNDGGVEKLKEARESGKGTLPGWIAEEMKSAKANPE